MKRFVEGEDRRQAYLLPESLDDYVAEDNPVRVVEVFIDELDLGALGFEGVQPAVTGRPAYHPSTMLKLYLYGYLNRLPSSRRLEREAGRNIELMWLTGRLAPDFKTIANFRRDNGPAIRAVCAQFVVLCRRMKLFTKAIVAIDGSKFKAVNNRDKNFTVAKVAKRLQQVDASIVRYLAALDRSDREESDVAEAKTTRIKDKIAGLRRQMQALKAMEQQVQAAPDKQVSLTDPDARSMATSGRGTGVVGYNVQTAVDTEHHLIVAHEVTNVGHDRTQLAPMGLKAKAATGCEELTALADRGYFNGGAGSGVAREPGCCPASPRRRGPGEDGFFTRQDFVYDAENDHYICPAGQKLTKGLRVRSDRKDDIDHYQATLTVPASPVRSSPDALRTSSSGSSAGRTKTCSTGCRPGSTGCPTLCSCAARPSNLPLRHPQILDGKHPLPGPRPSKKSEPRIGSLHVLAYNLEANDPDPRRRPILMEAIRA